MGVCLAVGFAVVVGDDYFICHAFIVIVEFAVGNFAGSDAGSASCGFGMTGWIWDGEKSIATRNFVIPDSDGTCMASGVFVETAGLCRTFFDLRHDDLNMFHDDLPNIG